MALVPNSKAEIDSGGESPISSSDSKRASKAIERVTPSLRELAAEKNLKLGSPVFIRILKEERELEIWLRSEKSKSFSLFKTYRVAYWGPGKLGPKLRQGDAQAPEGFYYFKAGNLNPYSKYHLAMNIGYPNAFDRAHDRTGSHIMIHGSTASIGCYAMTDRSIEEIYALVSHAFNRGQPFIRVHVFPFRMTADRLEKEKDNPNHAFWLNLKEGYEAFEDDKTPPNVLVREKRYVFE